MSNQKHALANVSINLNKAITWIRNWRDNYLVSKDGEGMPLDLKGWRVSKSDFISMMNNDEVEYVRLYLAAGPDEDNSGPEVPKLIIVGVDINNKDVLGPNNNQIYEMTRPCPRMCDVTSPLYTLIDPEEPIQSPPHQ